MSSELLNIIVSVIIGVITGLISGYIVTKYYRCKDKERDIVSYLSELDVYLTELNEAINNKRIEINEEDINKVLSFFSKKGLPYRYKWIKFKHDDLKKVVEVEDYIKRLLWSAQQCKLNLMRTEKTKEEESKIHLFMIDIIMRARIDINKHMVSIMELKKQYLNIDKTDK